MEVSKGVIIRSDPSVTYIESLGIKHVGSDNKIIRCFFRELTHEYPQNVSPQEAMDQLIKFLHKLIKWYPDHKVELWPMHFFPIGNDDREFAKILCAHFGNSHITSELRPKSPLDILKAMSEASFCVCMRYHSVVFASKVGAPFIAIDYTSGGKVNSFLKDTNQLSRMTSLADIDKITKENFQRMLSVSISTNQSTSPQRLKVTHLNTSDIQGGAAIAAYRLSEGLQKIGVESKMIVRYKQSDDISVFKVEPEEDSSLGGNYLSNVIQKEVIDNHRTDISNTLFYWPLVGQDVSEIPLIRSSDVIHLHWISFFQSLKTLERIADLNIPIVWTIYDQWPFTGGCHYSAGCLKYQIECNHCPQIIDYYDTTQEVFLKKRDVIRKMTPVVVTPSSWMADCVRHSAIMKDFQIEVIPNSVNPNVFYPTRKSEARRLLGLDEQGYYLLFGADNIEEKRKGYASLIKALEICKSNEAFQGLMRNGNLRILSFGTPSSELDEYQIPVLSLGYLPTEHKTALAYAAADIFILPSLEDNFPNTVLEAMSCGTPVLANSTGGIPELIDDGENGYLLPVGNYEALSERILQLLKNPRLIEKLGLAGRRKIVKNFTQEMQASRYLELYNQLVPSPQSGTSVNYPALSNVLFVKTLLPEALNNNPAISTLMSTTNELSGQVDQRNQWLKEQNQRISELSDQVTQSDQWLEEQNQRVNELSEQVAQRNQWLEGQNQRMSELSDQVVQRNQWLEEQNQRVNELSEQVAQRNQWLEEQNKRISELSDQVAQRNHWLEEQNQRISELSEQVAQRDQWLEDQKRQIDDAQERIIRIEHYLGIPVVRKIQKYLGERISKPSDQG